MPRRRKRPRSAHAAAASAAVASSAPHNAATSNGGYVHNDNRASSSSGGAGGGAGAASSSSPPLCIDASTMQSTGSAAAWAALKDASLTPKQRADRVFAWLIAPMDVDTFFANYYEQQPLFIKRKAPKYYHGILTSNTIRGSLLHKSVLSSLPNSPDHICRACCCGRARPAALQEAHVRGGCGRDTVQGLQAAPSEWHWHCWRGGVDQVHLVWSQCAPLVPSCPH